MCNITKINNLLRIGPPCICDKCFTVYNHEKLIRKRTHTWLGFHNEKIDGCPRAHCTGTLINIDEDLCYPVRELWRMKIKTYHSCAGHLPPHNKCFPLPYLTLDNQVFTFAFELKNTGRYKSTPIQVEYCSDYKIPNTFAIRLNSESKKVEIGYMSELKNRTLFLSFIYDFVEAIKKSKKKK